MSIDGHYGIQVHRGRYWGHEPLFKFGFNSAVSTDEETVWDEGGIYAYPTSASVMKVSSSNAADTSTVVIAGLDANYDEIEETVTITGQTAVNTTKEFLRVFRARVTADEPAGNIYIGTGTVSSGVPANQFAKITAGENQTLMAVWTVPAGYTAYLHQGTISSGTATVNKFSTTRLKVKPFGEVMQTKAIITLHNSFVDFDFGSPLAITEKSDIEARALTSSGTDSVSVTFSIIYVKNR